MTIADPTRQPAKSELKQPAPNPRDQEDLVQLDSLFNRLKRAIPETPYIISAPTLDPYAHRSRQESRSWMLGHLFDPDEELLQYRTYYYREHGQDCLVLQSGEDDRPQVEKKANQYLSAPTTGPKKKISLSDYKRKQANGVITPGKKISPELPPTKLPQTYVNGVKEGKTQTPPKPAPKPDESQSRKRKLEDSATTKPSSQAHARLQDNMPSAKKPRKDSLSEHNTTLDTSAHTNGTPHGLPPLLSPVHASLPNPHDLPPILSPTLPAPIRTELEKIETRKRAESSASASSLDKKSHHLAVPESKPHRNDDGSKGSPQPRNTVKPVSGVKSPATEPAELQRELEQVAPEKKSLIVRLKFKKVARTLERILKLPPSRKPPTAAEKRERQENMKERLSKPQPKPNDVDVRRNKEAAKAPVRNSTGSAKAEGNATSKVAEKRPRLEEDMPSSKRQKTHASRENPLTPIQQTIPSPTKSNKSSAQKPQGVYSTPSRKVVGAINMIRTNSGEGVDSTVATPSSGVKNYDSKAPPTSAPVNGKMPKQSLHHMSMKLNTLGRSLKHECQAILNKGKGIAEEDSKRAAVIFLECLLSYMAGYYVQDVLRLRSEVDNTWKTLLPFSMSYSACTRQFKHLEGLRLYLSVIVASCVSGAICLRSRPLAHDSPPDHGPPASSDPTASLTVLSDHVMKMLRFASEARQALPIEDVMTCYPETWAGRETVANPSKDGAKIVGDSLAGPYFLPIGIDTSPIHGVRFGLAFLKEYCRKEGLQYEFKVNLEGAEGAGDRA